MLSDRTCKSALERAVVAASLILAGMLSGPAMAGGMMAYELGTADVGLASAGYGTRAQDASTVFTNPAGMTRLDGNQFLGAGQLFWSNTKFSIDSGTSPGLGSNNGGYAVGHQGWFPGGSAFASYTVSPDVKLAAVFRKDGRLFASYGESAQPYTQIARQFFGDQHGETGHRALPHFGARDTDRHRVIGRDRDPAVDFGRAIGGVRRRIGERNGKAQRQAAGRRAGADKQ